MKNAPLRWGETKESDVNEKKAPGGVPGSKPEKRQARPDRDRAPSEAESVPKGQRSTSGSTTARIPHRRASVILLRALVACAVFSLLALVGRLLLLLIPIGTITVEGNAFYTKEELCEAAGLKEGDAIFGFSVGDADERLLEQYPLLSEVELERTLDGALTIRVKAHPSTFYIRVSGNYYMLGRADYRVLVESETPDRFLDYGLYEISLPDVRVAFLGEPLEFGEEERNYYLQVLFDTLDRSVFKDRITGVRAAERFGISFIVDGKYNVTVGSVSDLTRKLTYLSKMMESESSTVFRSGKPAEVNLSDLTAPTARSVEKINTQISAE